MLKIVDIAMLVTEEKEILQLCRILCGLESSFNRTWLDVLRLFSLEPHPQDDLLRTRGNRLDWVIQTWNENHPDKPYPFPPGVVDGPFPGQPGYELPKRLFRHKYCMGGTGSCGRWIGLKICQSCKHRYYCSEVCQQSDWGCGRQQEDQIKRAFMPTKYIQRPWNRLGKPGCWRSHHQPQCKLTKYYKQWVQHQKQTRNRGDDEEGEEPNEEKKEGVMLKS